MKKEIFIEHLKSLELPQTEEKIRLFEQYYEQLVETNKVVNLFSRKTNLDDLWTLHFLDSILSVPLISFAGMKILDFGTGGGLPGVPLQILFPSAEVTMLDSRRKKIDAIKNMTDNLSLQSCDFISSRLEELSKSYYGKFDRIVCRSVRIESKYKNTLLALLKPNGKLVLYKSKNLDDVEQFTNAIIHDVSHPEIGERKIIEINKL